MTENPKVFISYAHKNQAYEDRVLEFANKLRSEGIDAMIDQYEEAPSEGWPRWMEHQIKEAEFVIILCEETYYQKMYSQNRGKGVVWEASVIYQILYDDATETQKFIAVVFEDNDQEFIPTPLKAFTFYNVSNKQQYERLYWRIRGVKNAIKPPLGAMRPVPKKERKTLFFSSPIVPEKWDRAMWRGVVYLWCGDAPGIGLFFDNYTAGKSIFYEWKHLYGDLKQADSFIKVDYIVPPFPENCWVRRSPDENYGRGYFLHIGPNVDDSITRAMEKGLKIENTLFASLSRYRWMDENSGSLNRNQFIENYQEYKKYYLVPVGLKDDSVPISLDNMIFDMDCSIPMKKVDITAGVDLEKDSICTIVLRKPEECHGQKRH